MEQQEIYRTAQEYLTQEGCLREAAGAVGRYPRVSDFESSRYIHVEKPTTGINGNSAHSFDLSGGALAQRIGEEFESETMAERGVIVASEPDACIKGAKLLEATGVDGLQFLMATETAGHEAFMKSIEISDKYVIPEFRKKNKGPREPNCPI